MTIQISITHSCGHTHNRDLTIYMPYKKSWVKMPDVWSMDAPEVVKQKLAEKRAKVEKAALKYWSRQLCLDCWKESRS